jgi:hypothetical protein
VRRGIGLYQGRVLALLVLMEPRPVATRILASVADVTGDQTRGRRRIAVMLERGLIVQSSPVRGVGDAEGPFWRATPKGQDSFQAWFLNRVKESARVAS